MEKDGWQFRLNSQALDGASEQLWAQDDMEAMVLHLLHIKRTLAELGLWSPPFDVSKLGHDSQQLTAAMRVSKGFLKVDGKKRPVHFLQLGVGPNIDPLLFQYSPLAAIDFSPTREDFDPQLLRHWPYYFHPQIYTFSNGDQRTQQPVLPHEPDYQAVLSSFRIAALREWEPKTERE